MKAILVLLPAAGLALVGVLLRRSRRPAAASPATQAEPSSTGAGNVSISSNIEAASPAGACTAIATDLPELDATDATQPFTTAPSETLANVGSLAEELGPLAGTDRQLTLLAVRVDDLPGVSRSFGDIVGQRLLQEVARTIRRALRPVDICARWESDRFVAVLPDLDPGTARTVVSRIRRAVRSLSLVTHGGDELQIDVTVGSARSPEDGGTFDDLLLAAGRRLESEATPTENVEDESTAERLRRAVPLVSN